MSIPDDFESFLAEIEARVETEPDTVHSPVRGEEAKVDHEAYRDIIAQLERQVARLRADMESLRDSNMALRAENTKLEGRCHDLEDEEGRREGGRDRDGAEEGKRGGETEKDGAGSLDPDTLTMALEEALFNLYVTKVERDAAREQLQSSGIEAVEVEVDSEAMEDRVRATLTRGGFDAEELETLRTKLADVRYKVSEQNGLIHKLERSLEQSLQQERRADKQLETKSKELETIRAKFHKTTAAYRDLEERHHKMEDKLISVKMELTAWKESMDTVSVKLHEVQMENARLKGFSI